MAGLVVVVGRHGLGEPDRRRSLGAQVEGVGEHLRPTSAWLDGANRVMSGTFDSSTMSSTPWCDAPSSPVIPARSSTNTTGWCVQADVEVDLVDRPGEERGVDRDHGPEPAHGHAGGGGDGVLLGDADVEQRSGNASPKGSRPVESGMAAVIATSSGRRRPRRAMASEKASV